MLPLIGKKTNRSIGTQKQGITQTNRIVGRGWRSCIDGYLREAGGCITRVVGGSQYDGVTVASLRTGEN